MEFKAYAKVNWDLRVLGKRPDGFHALDTVMVNVSLHDTLFVEPADDIALTCSDSSLATDDTNLVVKAARALKAASGYTGGARIHLVKNIPMGGGMGGGSSDAACALRALNLVWNLNWETARLQPLAAALGSDVAFFLHGGWCRCLGRGEIVEPLGIGAEFAVKLLLILPPLHVPTPQVYKKCSFAQWDGKTGLRVLTDVQKRIMSCVSKVNTVDSLGAFPLFNDLTEPACLVEPRLIELQRVLQQYAPGRWLMSGSGAVHFVVQPRLEDEAALSSALKKTGTNIRALTAMTCTPF